MKKIYIAGFDVFKADSIQIGEKYKKLCQEYGFIGFYPLDNFVDFSQAPKQIAQDIFKANKMLIQEADIVIANLNPFRGKEADSGTVWECGYATALGKKVYGYMHEDISYLESFSDQEKFLWESDKTYVDKDNMFIEDFEYPLNLMIACSVEHIVQGGFEDTLKRVDEERKKEVDEI